MRKFPVRLLVPVLAAPAIAASAHSPGMTVVTPAGTVHRHINGYLEDLLDGFTCGFTSSTDDTGLVFNDGRQHGEIDGGPMTVVNSAGGTVSDVTTTCWIQLNRADPCAVVDAANCAALGAPVGARYSTVTGPTGSLIDTLDYAADHHWDDTYLCTRFTWNSSKGGGSFDWDDDDLTAGVQCALAAEI
jgi:hypothetical protein